MTLTTLQFYWNGRCKCATIIRNSFKTCHCKTTFGSRLGTENNRIMKLCCASLFSDKSAYFCLRNMHTTYIILDFIFVVPPLPAPGVLASIKTFDCVTFKVKEVP